MIELTTIGLLDLCKSLKGLDSDYKLWRYLGWSKQTVSRYRRRHGYLGEKHALELASVLEIHPALVLAITAAERSECPAAADAWRAAARALVIAHPRPNNRHLCPALGPPPARRGGDGERPPA